MDTTGKRRDNFIVAVRVRPLIPREVTAASEQVSGESNLATVLSLIQRLRTLALIVCRGGRGT